MPSLVSWSSASGICYPLHTACGAPETKRLSGFLNFEGMTGWMTSAPASRCAGSHLSPSYIRASCNERTLWSPTIATAAKKPKAENANAH